MIKITVEKLKVLAAGIDGRSESSRLGDIIGEVEYALMSGVKRKVVLETLRQNYGFKMSMSGFEKALKKFRKKPSENPAKTTITGKENNMGSRQLMVIPTIQVPAIASSAMVTQPTVTKKFLTPGELRNIRITTIKESESEAEEESLERESYDINYEEI